MWICWSNSCLDLCRRISWYLKTLGSYSRWKFLAHFSLWGLCTCYGPENFYDDSWYIGSNSEHLFKFSSSWIRCIKSKKTENSDKLHLFKQKILLRPVQAVNCQIWQETISKHRIDTKEPFSDRLPKLQFSAQNSDTSVTDFSK